MSLVQVIILSIIQGLTEFLPVSSSGHLVLSQKIFEINEPLVLFDILLHLGTLFAIFIFFYKDLFSLVVDWKKKKNVWLFLIVGSIPAAITGFFLNSKIDKIFNSLPLLGGSWIFFGLLLLFFFRFKLNKNDLKRKESEATPVDGLVVGSFQALALLPGISRSGSTIIGGLSRKFSRETAFYLSFLLSIPAILGAVALKMKDSHLDGINIYEGLLAVLFSAIVGYFSLKILQKFLKSDKFYLFGFYCLVLGILVVLATIR